MTETTLTHARAVELGRRAGAAAAFAAARRRRAGLPRIAASALVRRDLRAWSGPHLGPRGRTGGTLALAWWLGYWRAEKAARS
jgi:hypothetical protein